MWIIVGAVVFTLVTLGGVVTAVAVGVALQRRRTRRKKTKEVETEVQGKKFQLMKLATNVSGMTGSDEVVLIETSCNETKAPYFLVQGDSIDDKIPATQAEDKDINSSQKDVLSSKTHSDHNDNEYSESNGRFSLEIQLTQNEAYGQISRTNNSGERYDGDSATGDVYGWIGRSNGGDQQGEIDGGAIHTCTGSNEDTDITGYVIQELLSDANTSADSNGDTHNTGYVIQELLSDTITSADSNGDTYNTGYVIQELLPDTMATEEQHHDPVGRVKSMGQDYDYIVKF